MRYAGLGMTESPDAVRFYTGTPRLQPGSMLRDVLCTTMQGQPSPSSRTTRASTWFLGHTAIPPLPHPHAQEPESPSGIEPVSRIRARRSSVDIMFRRSSLYLLWLRARDGLRLRRPCPSHPARAQDAH